MNNSGKLFERVIQQIQSDITDGKFIAGEKIPSEAELMNRYHVGRSTIREAIKMLSISGILKVQQGSGTYLSKERPSETIDQRLHRADFDEVNAVRKLLEFEILRLAVQNHTPGDLQKMGESLDSRIKAIREENHEACVNADLNFHLAIAYASCNSVLADLYKSFTTTIRDFFVKREPMGLSHFALSQHLHEQLFKYIKGKKSKLAQQVMQEILDNNY
jgi:DNA-binding FadR family transcriptional regulator